jgi:hypothetical protein
MTPRACSGAWTMSPRFSAAPSSQLLRPPEDRRRSGLPDRRRVFRRNPDGTSNLNMPSITIDIDDITIS